LSPSNSMFIPHRCIAPGFDSYCFAASANFSAISVSIIGIIRSGPGPRSLWKLIYLPATEHTENTEGTDTILATNLHELTPIKSPDKHRKTRIPSLSRG